MNNISFLNRSLREKLLIVLLYAASACVLLAAAASLSLPIYFNHWIGWFGRPLFMAVSVLVYVLIVTCFLDAFRTRPQPGRFWAYWRNLALVLSLLIVEFAGAGIAVHPGTQCWQISSGKVEPCQPGFRWDSPFGLSTILLRFPSQNWTVASALFPGRLLTVNLNASVRPGASAEKLRSLGYFGIGPNDSDMEQIRQAVDIAVQYALLESNAKVTDLVAGKTPIWQQEMFIAKLRAELKHRLPDYLVANPEIKPQT